MKKHIQLFLIFSLFLLIGCKARHIVLNKGVAGNNSYDLLKRLDKDVLAEQPDLVIIMVGTNDMVNSHKFISYEQFITNYQLILNKVKGQASVLILNPPPVDTEYVFQRHKSSLFMAAPNAKIDSMNKLIRNLAKTNEVSYMDLNSVFRSMGSPDRSFNSLIINKENFGIEDGIHPTKEGYLLMARHVFDHLKKAGLLKKRSKVICFGDSMTYGSFMVGKGTAEGETYPAFLKALLNNKTEPLN